MVVEVVAFPVAEETATTASRENVSLKFDHATRPHGTITPDADSPPAPAPAPASGAISRGAQVEVVAAAEDFFFPPPEGNASSPLSCASDLDLTYLRWFWWNAVSSYAR